MWGELRWYREQLFVLSRTESFFMSLVHRGVISSDEDL